MAKIQVKFILERETRGALFYKEATDRGGVYPFPNAPGAKIGAIYIRKTAFKDGSMPPVVTVTITTGEDAELAAAQ